MSGAPAAAAGAGAGAAPAAAAAADAKHPTPTWEVKLSPLEEKVFTKILNAAKHHGLKTQIRVAGGWVRDKLLGRESVDIDLALDDMMGADFAAKVNEYLKAQGDKVHDIGVIKLNPGQSKHLETATFKVDGMSIDVNNLRTETYDENSRIPQMQLGTAEQDCLRRDFTINSMFYNLNTRKVEDLSGKGLDDLKNGFIRTPLPPLTTFKDDPLRVLRAIRFAGRFQFRVDPELAKAASDAQVRHDLLHKVSRERFGIELNKMLSEQRSAYASFKLLCDYGLRAVVFHVGDMKLIDREPAVQLLHETKALVLPLHAVVAEDKAEDKATTELAISRMRVMQRYVDLYHGASQKDERRALLLASFLSPYYGYRFMEKKNKFMSVAAALILNAIKFPAKDAKQSTTLIDAAHHFLRVIALHEAAVKGGATADAMQAVQLESGLLARSVGADTPLALDMACVLLAHAQLPRTAAAAADAGAAAAAAAAAAGGGDGDATALGAVTKGSAYAAYRLWLERDSQLLGGGPRGVCWGWKPFLDGKVLGDDFGLKGPQIGAATQKIIEWQVLHPAGTPEECRAYIATLYPPKAAGAAAGGGGGGKKK